MQPHLSPFHGGSRCRAAQGNPADESPRRARQLPVAAGGNRRRAPLAWAPKSRVRGARARPGVTFGRSQVSPPVFAATQPHSRRLRPRLSFAAWRAACCPHPRSRVADVRLADGAQPGTGPQTRPLRLPYAPCRSRSAVSRPPGRPCSSIGECADRASRGAGPLLSPRAGAAPTPAPCPRGRPPHGPLLSRGAGLCAREGPPGGAVRAGAAGGSLLYPQGTRDGWWGMQADRKERSPRAARAAPAVPQHPPRGHLVVTWDVSTRATLLSGSQLACTL